MVTLEMISMCTQGIYLHGSWTEMELVSQSELFSMGTSELQQAGVTCD